MQPMVFAWKALSRRLHKAEITDHNLPKSPFGFKWTAAATEVGLAAIKMYKSEKRLAAISVNVNTQKRLTGPCLSGQF